MAVDAGAGDSLSSAEVGGAVVGGIIGVAGAAFAVTYGAKKYRHFRRSTAKSHVMFENPMRKFESRVSLISIAEGQSRGGMGSYYLAHDTAS